MRAIKPKGKDPKTAFNNAASNLVDLEDFCGPDFLCIKCKNGYSIYDDNTGCKAFPNVEIPDDIWLGDFKHTKRHPKQKNDILFEPIESK